MAASEAKDTLDRIVKHPAVQAVFLVNNDGLPIRPAVTGPTQGMGDDAAYSYMTDLAQLTAKARSLVRELDPQNDLTFMRLRSHKLEIMVAPEKEFLLCVVQDPTVSNKKANA